jgi:DNA ligase 1
MFLPRRRRIAAVMLFVLNLALPGLLHAAEMAAPVMLANTYRPGIDLTAYWVSEKYDGVRAYWDGTTLRTRGGEHIFAPDWFVRGLPKIALDGELWAGRGKFQEAVSTVRQQTPNDAAWRRIRFMVFDLPAEPGTFDQRLAQLRARIPQLNLPWVLAVEQHKLVDHAALHTLLQKTVRDGGEGLMLHRGDSLYRAERNDDLLKLKPYSNPMKMPKPKSLATYQGKVDMLGASGH